MNNLTANAHTKLPMNGGNLTGGEHSKEKRKQELGWHIYRYLQNASNPCVTCYKNYTKLWNLGFAL